jgi:hypothetical protein
MQSDVTHGISKNNLFKGSSSEGWIRTYKMKYVRANTKKKPSEMI